ncbi:MULTISPECIES: GNA1162 family protein [Anaeromyxobacter]|uniref:GNA1162 family protein n=1 Tax=Anaeromyxobacter TaxID=161492 RepID=UPI001F5875AD|nr:MULTISPECIES: GNA1162 family protein [unclassified Anaeromyxobacter]
MLIPRKNACTLIATLLAISLVACSGPGARRRYQNAEMDFGSVHTVLVMPFSNLSRDSMAGERVRDVFVNMLLASGSIYVLPHGEVIRGASRVGVVNASAPNVEEAVKLGGLLKADAVITGVVREYGELRSGTASSNVVSLSLQLIETQTGKVVWSASTTKGGVGFGARLLGGGGAPLNDVTEEAVDDLLNKLFK